jgi:hypothetical protein
LWHSLRAFAAANTILRLQTMTSAAFHAEPFLLSRLRQAWDKPRAKPGQTFIAAKSLPEMTKCQN